MVIAVALILAWTVREVVRKSAETASTLAKAFNSGTITTLFQSYTTQIQPTSRLQFTTLSQTEIFERHDERLVMGIPLPEVVVEAKAPVDYTYFVDLKGTWKFTVQGGEVNVIAPPIQFNKPAIDASRIEYREVKSSVWRREGPVMQDLKESLTGFSIQRAKQNIPLVREQGRKQIEEFVKTWLLHDFSDGANHNVNVRFADELTPESKPDRLLPPARKAR